MQSIKRQPNIWRAIKGKVVIAGDAPDFFTLGIGDVRESACYPDQYFWANQHPYYGRRGDQHDDIAVPAMYIARSDDGVYLSITRREFLALPQRWQGDPPVFHTQPVEVMDRFAKPYRSDQRFGDADVEPMEPVAVKPRTVRSALEDGIAELEAVERRRQNLIVEYGTLPPEMEELFAAHRKQIKDRRLAQLERELGGVMGWEKEND